ncbi:MAG: hypothetical protein LBQ50_00295 [Planctomycetaceae bacterium]|nr:hypothetical protein [Planctomycetaceae bacterium]
MVDKKKKKKPLKRRSPRGSVFDSCLRGDAASQNLFRLDKIFLFQSPIGYFCYDDYLEDEIYEIEDPRLEEQNTVKEKLREFYEALSFHGTEFINNPKRVAVMEYSAALVQALEMLRKRCEQEDRGNIMFITFYHNDEESELLWGTEPLKTKSAYLESFMQFPTLHRIEIKMHEYLTREYLNNLYMKAFSVPLMGPDEESVNYPDH